MNALPRLGWSGYDGGMLSLEVLYEDNHCLAVAKPAGWLTMGFPGAPATLIDAARAYLKQRYHKPGNVFLGVVQRLDKPVSGVVLFARTSKAAARLAEQFRERTIQKTYWAVVEGPCQPPSGTMDDWLVKQSATGRVAVVPRGTPEARHARLDYRRIQTIGRSAVVACSGDHDRRPRPTARTGVSAGVTPNLSLLELCPMTGRTHQLRVQLASRGMFIVGDRKYGSRFTLGGAIALHARSLTFRHPVRREPVTVSAPQPPRWQQCFGLSDQPAHVGRSPDSVRGP